MTPYLNIVQTFYPKSKKGFSQKHFPDRHKHTLQESLKLFKKIHRIKKDFLDYLHQKEELKNYFRYPLNFPLIIIKIGQCKKKLLFSVTVILMH